MSGREMSEFANAAGSTDSLALNKDENY